MDTIFMPKNANIYECKKCDKIIEVFKVKIIHNGIKWETNITCCNKEMKQILTEDYKGMPTIQRNEN